MSEKYSFIIIPDTQEICRIHPEILDLMYQKIKANYQKWNSKIILHLGDIVNDGNRDENQFLINNKEFNEFDSMNIPYLISIGNHDYDNLVSVNRDAIMFNDYFGPQRYGSNSVFFEKDKSENMYTLIEINEINYMFISLEFGPRKEVIEWANNVIKNHLDYRVIMITHSHIEVLGQWTTIETRYNAKSYSGLHDASNGEDIWNNLLRKHSNITAVFSGHHVGKNISYRYDLTEEDTLVLQAFFNWQYDPSGGEGRFIVMEVSEETNQIDFKVFNPVLDNFEDRPGYNFTLPLNPNNEIEKYKNKKYTEE